ncbi:MAG: hypothetical protein NZ703_02190, partial [Gemmataceae bacterium]|nr:hypothetical protein [Gemmataceae bacterium]
VMTLLTEASRIVDRPGQAYTGLSLSDFAADILNYAGVEVPEARFVALQTELSAANHLGEYERADEVWQSYKQQEEKLLALGLRGLELMAEISNRRAVALIDQFRFDDAHQILQDVLSRMEQSLRPLGEIGGATAPAPIRLLGTLYGTLGQAYALQTEPDHLLAEKCFRQALQHFQEPADRERQWVYLGHLACDKEQGGETLWQEVCANLPQLNSHIPICQEGRQYQLALQIKGIYRFRPLDQVRQFLQAWQSASWQSAYSQESREQHPFGLIHQGIGMLWLRLSQETKDKAAAHAAIHSFDAATQHMRMRKGGSLLQVLAYFADIRRWLITLQCSVVPSLCERRLRELLQGLQGYVVEHYGERVWNVSQTGLARGHFGRFDPGPDCPINLRAQAILAAVRFNYW